MKGDGDLCSAGRSGRRPECCGEGSADIGEGSTNIGGGYGPGDDNGGPGEGAPGGGTPSLGKLPLGGGAGPWADGGPSAVTRQARAVEEEGTRSTPSGLY